MWDSDTDELVAYGHITTNPNRATLSERLEFITRRITTIRLGHGETLGNQVVYAEQPIHNRLHSATTTLRIGMVHGAVRVALLRVKGDEIVEVPIGTVKVKATGKGNAKKPEMIAAAKARWGVKLTSDEADAAFVAVTGFSR